MDVFWFSYVFTGVALSIAVSSTDFHTFYRGGGDPLGFRWLSYISRGGSPLYFHGFYSLFYSCKGAPYCGISMDLGTPLTISLDSIDFNTLQGVPLSIPMNFNWLSYISLTTPKESVDSQTFCEGYPSGFHRIPRILLISLQFSEGNP